MGSAQHVDRHEESQDQIFSQGLTKSDSRCQDESTWPVLFTLQTQTRASIHPVAVTLQGKVYPR